MRWSPYARLAVVVCLLLVPSASLRAQDDVQARMQEWSKALGVDCQHCHVGDQWSLAYMPNFDMAFRMAQMVKDLNAGALKNYEPITCATCHQGSISPPKVTREQWERDARRYEAVFNGDSSLALQMGVFTASLGTGCSFCHDPNNWGSDDNPMKGMGRRMRGMVGSINKYFAGVKNPEIGCMTCHQGKLKPARTF
ncbi:MAG: photosynthetic reaction center cytochrome c subunit family protein [Vicinamibacterales bacterium]